MQWTALRSDHTWFSQLSFRPPQSWQWEWSVLTQWWSAKGPVRRICKGISLLRCRWKGELKRWLLWLHWKRGAQCRQMESHLNGMESKVSTSVVWMLMNTYLHEGSLQLMPWRIQGPISKRKIHSCDHCLLSAAYWNLRRPYGPISARYSHFGTKRLSKCLSPRQTRVTSTFKFWTEIRI